MNEKFCVLTEGWIPVVDSCGAKHLLGIWDVLTDAPKLKEISDASPMVEYSLYRFLALFLMDALRPQNIEDLEDLLEDGQFDMRRIQAYIDCCQEEGVSFDLFDKKRPFLQSPYRPDLDKEPKPVAALDYTRASGNNHTHYDHAYRQTISYDQAARLLLPAQWFCTAAAQGYPSNVNASPPYFTVVQGETLFQTLVFSLCVTDRIPLPFDTPPVLWRNTDEIIPKKEVTQTSWMYGMLFPARRVLLIPDHGSISEVYLSQGLNYSAKESWTDPYVTYRYSDKGRAPWRPKQEKAIWRNLNDLINAKGKQTPYLLRQYIELEKQQDTAQLSLYGVQTDQASYLVCQRHDLKIPLPLFQDDRSVNCIKCCIGAAETTASALSRSFSSIQQIPGQISSQAVQHFYDLCEQEFWMLCANSIGRQSVDLLVVYRKWCDFLIMTATAVREAALATLHLRSHALLKAAANEKELRFAKKKIQEMMPNGM